MTQQERIEQAAANHKAYAEEFKLKSDTSFICGVDWYRNHQWISVDEELPPHKPIGENQRFSKTVFLMQANGDVIIDSFDFEMPSNFITHWMEIPKKGGEE